MSVFVTTVVPRSSHSPLQLAYIVIFLSLFQLLSALTLLFTLPNLIRSRSAVSSLTMGEASFYEVLGVSTDATETQVRSLFHNRSTRIMILMSAADFNHDLGTRDLCELCRSEGHIGIYSQKHILIREATLRNLIASRLLMKSWLIQRG